MSVPDEKRQPQAGDEVIFYGSLMRGLGASDAIPSRQALRYIGPCQIEGDLYDLGAYPGLRKTNAAGASVREGDPIRVVQAELYTLLDPCVVEELDHFEGYEPDQPEESLYLRRRVPLLNPANLSRTEKSAWVYIYNHSPEASQRIDSGDWRAHLLARSQLDSETPRAQRNSAKEE